ncbi:hypothetical protein KFU94_57555 [Chloroflexi bacterium TSY]|nr:hypothetical protein [Chloroflexi bacterium TSY]
MVEPAYSATLLSTDMQSVLVARLDRLAQEVKQVVQTAAVLGREFSILVLSQMLRDARTWTEPAEDGGPLDVQASGVQALDDQALSDRVRSAQTAAVWSALSEIRYLFRHTLLREAAYEMQLRARLRLLHQLAAEGIEKLYGDADLGAHYPDLVYHYRQANLSDREFRYAKLAAARAATAYANEDAIEYYTRALALTPVSDLEQRFDLLVERVKLYDLLGKRSEQADDLATLAELGAQLDDDKRRQTLHSANLAMPKQPEIIRSVPRQREPLPGRQTCPPWWAGHGANRQRIDQPGSLHRGPNPYRRSTEGRPKANLPWEEAASLHQLGIVHYQLGHYAEAQGYFMNRSPSIAPWMSHWKWDVF